MTGKTDSLPRVSVLMPAWNAGATIRTALASVVRQTYPAWECVVVDDGSTDDTHRAATAASSADARFRCVRTIHQGLVAALNKGLVHCRGEYIARMDADDVMHSERLSRQVTALLTDPALAAVGSHVRIFPRRNVTPRLRDYETWLNGQRTADDVQRDAYVECPVAHPTLMMRRDMAQLGYAQRDWPEDYDLILRALSRGLRIGVVPKRLLAWRHRVDSLSRTHSSYSIARFTACKAAYLASGFLAPHDTYVLWGYGDTGRTLRRALASHGKLPSHIVEVKASRIGQLIHGARVVPIGLLRELRGAPVVVSVARAAPRQEIRTALAQMQFIEGVDFVCAA
jgi:glycosyltransferase involved in cell wall biosynthesis